MTNRGEPSNAPPAKRGLVAELSRRHVWRAAVLYAGAVWALSQGIAQLGPAFGMPDWVTRWFVIACAIGFPFWIAFAWYYEWTPQGIQRESEIEGNDAAFHRRTGRKLDVWIIGVLIVAVVLLVTNQFVLHRDVTSVANAASAKTIAAELAKAPAKSVAVLPFASHDPKQQYFSDGMAEELISDLTQVNGLKVIGKYSSFKFRDSKDSPAQIAATLGVANLIEGSVRQRDGHIRIVVGMIRAQDGTSVWSHTYDQPLKDVFAIQSKIGQAVTAALKIKLLGNPVVDETKPPSGNVEAYQLMLQGRALARQATEAGNKQSIALLEKAVQLDPNYAYAWAILSDSRLALALGSLSGEARQAAILKARAALDHATALAPNALATLENRGTQFSVLDFNQIGALTEFRRAVALAPNDDVAKAFLAGQLVTMGQLQASVDLSRKAIATDPLRADWYYNLSYPLAALGYLDESEQAVRKTLALQPDFPRAYSQLTTIAILRNDPAAAKHDAAKATDPDSKAWALAAAQQIAGDQHAADAALQAYIGKYGKTQLYSVAELYALRERPDEMFQWLNRTLAHNKAALVLNLLSDPLLLRYKNDLRFAALCKQLGLPAPGEPLPAASTP